MLSDGLHRCFPYRSFAARFVESFINLFEGYNTMPVGQNQAHQPRQPGNGRLNVHWFTESWKNTMLIRRLTLSVKMHSRLAMQRKRMAPSVRMTRSERSLVPSPPGLPWWNGDHETVPQGVKQGVTIANTCGGGEGVLCVNFASEVLSPRSTTMYVKMRKSGKRRWPLRRPHRDVGDDAGRRGATPSLATSTTENQARRT